MIFHGKHSQRHLMADSSCEFIMIWLHYMNYTHSFTPMKNHFYENVILYSNKERTIIYKIVESWRLWINKSFHVKMYCHYALEWIYDCVVLFNWMSSMIVYSILNDFSTFFYFYKDNCLSFSNFVPI